MLTVRFAIAAAALLAAASTSAAVYRPSFDGPDLDPSLTFTGDPGISYSNSFGTLGIFKAGGVTKASSIFVSNFVVTGDFDAKLTLHGAKYLGSSQFFFQAALAGNPEKLFGDANRDSDIRAFDGKNFYFGRAVLPGSLAGKLIFLADSDIVFQLRRSNGFSDLFIGGQLLSHLTVGNQVFPPITFNFGLINTGNAFVFGEFVPDLDPADRAAFVSDFSITTPGACGLAAAATCVAPGVPEPASWALLIAGFGLTGAAMRRQRLIAV